MFGAMGQATFFAPSMRMITDFAEPAIHTNVAGGPSERRFSKYYTMGIKEWLQGDYFTYRFENDTEGSWSG